MPGGATRHHRSHDVNVTNNNNNADTHAIRYDERRTPPSTYSNDERYSRNSAYLSRNNNRPYSSRVRGYRPHSDTTLEDDAGAIDVDTPHTMYQRSPDTRAYRDTDRPLARNSHLDHTTPGCIPPDHAMRRGERREGHRRVIDDSRFGSSYDRVVGDGYPTAGDSHRNNNLSSSVDKRISLYGDSRPSHYYNCNKNPDMNGKHNGEDSGTNIYRPNSECRKANSNYNNFNTDNNDNHREYYRQRVIPDSRGTSRVNATINDIATGYNRQQDTVYDDSNTLRTHDTGYRYEKRNTRRQSTDEDIPTNHNSINSYYEYTTDSDSLREDDHGLSYY